MKKFRNKKNDGVVKNHGTKLRVAVSKNNFYRRPGFLPGDCHGILICRERIPTYDFANHYEVIGKSN